MRKVQPTSFGNGENSSHFREQLFDVRSRADFVVQFIKLVECKQFSFNFVVLKRKIKNIYTMLITLACL